MIVMNVWEKIACNVVLVGIYIAAVPVVVGAVRNTIESIKESWEEP